MGSEVGKRKVQSNLGVVGYMKTGNDFSEFGFPDYHPPKSKEDIAREELFTQISASPLSFNTVPVFPKAPPLYWYQKEALAKCRANKHIMVVFPTGKGKTMVGIALMEKLHTSTVIITPTIYLCRQWANEIKKYGGECSIISSETDGTFEPITIITYASALRHMATIAQYPIIVFDEAHHLVADEYYRIVWSVLQYNPNSQILGLTASPKKRGTEKVLQDKIFPVKYILTIAQLQKSEQHVNLELVEQKITLNPIDRGTYEKNWNAYLEAMHQFGGFPSLVQATHSTDKETRLLAFRGLKGRQQTKKLLSEHPLKISKTVDLIQQNEGNFVVFGETIEMVDTIHQLLLEHGIKAVKIHSKLKQNDREKDRIMQLLRRGESRVLVGAYAIEEGLDIPVLDNAVFVCIVTASDLKIIQRSGRVMRAQPGKEVKIHVIYAENTVETTNLAKIKRILDVKQ